ncbi:MAG: hypothetical protein ACJ76H_17080 [Bacteriovoracaceae bacterium]
MEEFLQMHSWEDVKVRSLIGKYGIAGSLGLVYMTTWIPLILLSAFSEKGLPDVAIHVRFLISLPLLLYSFPAMVKKQNWVLRHIQETRILDESDREALNNMLTHTDALMNSDFSRAIILALSYVTSIWTYLTLQRPLQQWSSFDGPPGWYYHLILQPLYNYVVLRVVFYLLVRFRICFSLARMKLNLRPAHGDGIGGLGFLSSTLVVFSLPAFALSSSSAAGAANLVIHNLVALEGLKLLVSVYAVLIILLLVVPYFLFIPPLLRARAEAIDLYGVLASDQTGDFYRSWLNHTHMHADTLAAGDFSAITDFGSEVGRVHSMRLIPVKPRDMIILVLAIAVPFFFVFSLKMSWQAIFNGLLSLLH